MGEVATPIKGISWTDLIVDIKVDSEGDFPLEKRSTIAPLISGRVKDKYPDRVYETRSLDDNGEPLITKDGKLIFKVKRTK